MENLSTSTSPELFTKILVANRGEIACRVMRTAEKMGVKTVAVYSDADKSSMHVDMADEAIRVGPAASSESYLKMERIIAVAKETGAQGIHPGYGFLSENAQFAELCAKEGVTFIGPPASAIRAMGSKSESKKIMTAADVPCVPGYHGENQDPQFLKQEAAKIGYPVLIKAVLGGGGKGMRIVETEDDFEQMLESSKREAIKSFNDDKVLIEKYLTRPRHIEVQVFADTHGNTVHLFERDCSVQRRHQKVIEEAPGPTITPELRKKLGDAAVRAAKAVNYVGAGTVEFIMDCRDNRFYFMEMNTRLQVEHPVTEMITGQDLVELQLRAASGFEIPVKQDDLSISGHSFEARIYAEDPDNNFLPQTGEVEFLRTMQPGPDVRVESAVRQGDQVSIHYDPMIAKLVVWAPDREQALRKLRKGLAQYRVGGLTTNIPFLDRIAAHPAFVRGEAETNFIEKFADDVLVTEKLVLDSHRAARIASAVVLKELNTARGAVGSDNTSPFGLGDAFRANTMSVRRLEFSGEQTTDFAVDVTYESASNFIMTVHIGEDETPEPVRVSGSLSDDGKLVSTVDGAAQTSDAVLTETGEVTLFDAAGRISVVRKMPAFFSRAAEEQLGSVLTPMPCKIEKVLVEPGQQVEKDTPLFVLEAMKMEHIIRAPQSGTIDRINFSSGDFVEQNKLLVTFEDEN